ncbi:MAG: PH domain-containing protein, partial [Ekhidna sp.]
LITYSIILLFVSLIWFGIRYQIKDQCLLILIGPIRLYSIPIEKIESINRSYNPLSSPAASLKRMKVNFDGGMVLISPKYEKQFVKNLKEINPDIYNGISWENENESILTRFVYSIL